MKETQDMLEVTEAIFSRYMKENGREFDGFVYEDMLSKIKRPKRKKQFAEAVIYLYDLIDFDRWQIIQDKIGIELSFEVAMGITDILYENDIEVLELY